MTKKEDSWSGAKRAIEEQLLPWFETSARNLPWRTDRTLYRVWVSEVMLQQTRVDAVLDYYNRWMKRFPSWHALARASVDEVLKLWEGLGYYSRGRNLHRSAQILVAESDGHFPMSADESDSDRQVVRQLMRFPGVGAYTAAAIASLALGKDAAVVDGNVIRVLCRLFAYGGDARSAAGKRQMQAWADRLLVAGRAGVFNESLMELGALICLPVAPKCADCPLQSICRAFEQGESENYPVLRAKKKVPHLTVGAAVTTNSKGEVLIAQRLEGDMLGGLWEFPGGKLEPHETIEECVARELKEELGIEVRVGERLLIVKHAYSHFKMTMHVYYTTIQAGRPRAIHCADFRWINVADLTRMAYSKADLQVVEKLQSLHAR